MKCMDKRPELVGMVDCIGNRIIDAYYSEPSEVPNRYKTDLVFEKGGCSPNYPENAIQVIVDANAMLGRNPAMAPSVAYRIINDMPHNRI